ncbi:MAG: hypothetical protein P8J87_02070, partial [Verrucomicrobiales bacterium]|nr:hypothetical protein [Verrucomicrobiales bacterium]
MRHCGDIRTGFGRDLARHATGRVVVALYNSGELPGVPGLVEAPSGDIQLSVRERGRGVFSPGYFDSISAVDSMEIEDGFFRERVVEDGAGSALVGYRRKTAERSVSDPHVAPVGRAQAVTATIEFLKPDRAELVLRDVSVAGRAWLGGERTKLATDFTAPLANLMAYSPEGNVGIAGMIRPDENRRNQGLFMLEPVTNDKVPVLFVHGLLSRPSTFKNTFNELLANPEIREGYQFWFYRYPTGVPVIFSGAALRQELKEVSERFGTGGLLGRMVVIGHSMGGLLSNLQIRRSREEDWGRYF